ncbi:MAG: fatty acid desaturase, partial [Fuerstiella sp.]|nr:fatty acid desaturase [Fuerstiella sp.]
MCAYTAAMHSPGKSTFKRSDGPLYHGAALLYAVSAYLIGFAGLFNEHWQVNLFSTLLLGHGMVIAAYMIHECAHNTVFRKNANNARLGTLLTWLCGAAYGTYDDIRYKHFRHHVDNDDVVWVDYEEWFQRHPVVYRVTRSLEAVYLPAHDLIMHFIMVFGAFII